MNARTLAAAAVSALSLAVAAPLAADPARMDTVVDVALASKDHTTLVAALQAAEYVDSLKNPGPFTVFAPTNAAFAKLPAGTVESLVKKENHDKLRKILQHHVLVSVYEAKWLQNGDSFGMVDGAKINVKVAKDGKISIDGANIVASVRCGNGIVHVVDAVLLPPEKK